MHFIMKSPCRSVKLRVCGNSLMKNKWAASGLISSPLLALAEGQLRCDYCEFIEHDLNICSIMKCVFKNRGFHLFTPSCSSKFYRQVLTTAALTYLHKLKVSLTWGTERLTTDSLAWNYVQQPAVSCTDRAAILQMIPLKLVSLTEQ